VKYAWIAAHRDTFEVEAMCRMLAVCTSGFYAAQKRPASARSVRRQRQLCAIRGAFDANRRTYGSPRVFEDLKDKGVKVCENTVAKIMREAGLRARSAKRFVPVTTDSRHAHPVFENLLAREFDAPAANRKWVTDITYIETGEGWLYLAAVLDLYSRKIVGWSMGAQMPSELVEDALKMAVARRNPGRGLLHHSDRGAQYACGNYQALLKAQGFTVSMSRTGNCYDNAVMESFWGTLKTELVYHENYATREEARRSIFEYIEAFYNRVRKHSSLGYLSPEAFEASMN
jgi:transposase InsO family protein